MDILTALGLSIPAGLNAYIPLLAVALAQRFEWLALRSPFDFLGSWWMITIIAVLLAVEIVADKIPAVDHVNDVIQTVVRPAAGGVVAVAASGGASGVTPWLFVLAGVLLAGGVHAVKATARPVVNATTAGVGAPVVSTVEDAGAVVLSVLAIVAPVLMVFVLAGLAYLFWRLWHRRRARRAETSLRPEAATGGVTAPRRAVARTLMPPHPRPGSRRRPGSRPPPAPGVSSASPPRGREPAR